MDDLAARIEALTDEECLSLTGPWKVSMPTACPSPYIVYGPSKECVGFLDLDEAIAEANGRNAAHVRERLRELMGRPATCG